MYLKKILCFVFLISPNFIRSQENLVALNSIYAEVLGNSASLFSFNYDRIILKKEKISLSFSVGVGIVPSNLINNALNNHTSRTNYLPYGIPISSNLSYGKNNKHLEIGFGFTYQQGMYGEGQKYSKTIFAVMRLGYRYQRENGGFFWKIGFTPFFPIKEFGTISNPYAVFPWGGVGAGYTF